MSFRKSLLKCVLWTDAPNPYTFPPEPMVCFLVELFVYRHGLTKGMMRKIDHIHLLIFMAMVERGFMKISEVKVTRITGEILFFLV